MRLKAELDTRALNRQIERAIQYSSRSAHVVVNSQAIAYLKRAIDATKRASKSDIAALEKKAVVGIVHHKKDGSPLKKPRKVYKKGPTVGEMMILKRLKVDKVTRKWGEVQAMAKKMIAAKKKSVAFIASGWVPGIRHLIRWDRERRGLPAGQQIARRKGAEVIGREKGWAREAKDKTRMKPVATLANKALIEPNQWDKKYGKKKKGNPMKYLKQGAYQAARETIVDIEKHIAKKLQRLKHNSTRKLDPKKP